MRKVCIKNKHSNKFKAPVKLNRTGNVLAQHESSHAKVNHIETEIFPLTVLLVISFKRERYKLTLPNI